MGDVRVSYEVTHDFVDKSTRTKLTANTEVDGTKFGAQIDGGLTEVSAERDVGDVNVQPSWLVQAKTARVRLMSKLGGDRVSAQVDYKPDGGDTNYEVRYDSKLEDAATWTASASVPYNSGRDLLDAAKVSL